MYKWTFLACDVVGTTFCMQARGPMTVRVKAAVLAAGHSLLSHAVKVPDPATVSLLVVM